MSDNVPEGDCCIGEPWMGNPNGLHSDDCPVRIAAVKAWEEHFSSEAHKAGKCAQHPQGTWDA
jgi:hypothetical protein